MLEEKAMVNFEWSGESRRLLLVEILFAECIQYRDLLFLLLLRRHDVSRRKVKHDSWKYRRER